MFYSGQTLCCDLVSCYLHSLLLCVSVGAEIQQDSDKRNFRELLWILNPGILNRIEVEISELYPYQWKLLHFFQKFYNIFINENQNLLIARERWNCGKNKIQYTHCSGSKGEFYDIMDLYLDIWFLSTFEPLFATKKEMYTTLI